MPIAGEPPGYSHCDVDRIMGNFLTVFAFGMVFGRGVPGRISTAELTATGFAAACCFTRWVAVGCCVNPGAVTARSVA
jgi:hypothetical protein